MPASKKTIRRSLLITSATLLTVSLNAPAFADTVDTADASPTASPGSSPSATPPATMSSLGGERLGRPGNQVDLGAGAPVLPPDITARSWIVADAESGDVLAAHNAHWRLPPASTLKMLFADTVLPKFPRSTSHKVAPSELAGIGEGSSVVGIKENQTYTVHDLWLGVFLKSGNDAVHVLSAMNGGVARTVKDMQAHADDLQALDTHVVSPDGYDARGQVSSAYDLTLFARSGLQKKDFREYCSTVRATFPGTTTGTTTGGKKGTSARTSSEIRNTNRLLSGDSDITPYQGIAGVKNGNTTNAGATFTGVAERGGKVLLVTVMNPEKKEHNEVYKEAAQLLDWGFQAADKVQPVGELVAPKGVDTTAQPGANASGGSSPGTGSGTGTAHASTKPVAASTTAARGGSSGIGIALGLAGGFVALLAAGVFLVNRRWPLPDLMRRRR
ncbi:D-alanyl-D-alanine carboxypeptidase family protein [Streptomyces sp. NPDC059445]|uniref:D-alanyl-D-alanine carboxypeptidase family protein n=1 Tax=Streptomyces sp. NPDC059445 TaxID=3346832 RepID=UPI0036BA684A